jgi:hypothetical protein
MTALQVPRGLFRLLPILGLAAFLAGCGVDGEPEQPTRDVGAPASALLVSADGQAR